METEIKNALESLQNQLKQALDEQAKSVRETGEISKVATDAVAKLQDEIKSLGIRLFDIEQKSANPTDPIEAKSFSKTVSEKAMESWNGSKAHVEVGTFYKALDSGDASGGVLVAPQRLGGILMPGLRRFTIRDLLAQGRITSNALEYVREDIFVNSAKPVKEKELKPESDIKFAKEIMSVKTIAHWMQSSRQIIEDGPALESYIGQRLLYGLQLEEEKQLLNGDGTGDNLVGLNTIATPYDATLTKTDDHAADVIAHAIYQVSESEFDASGILLNPKDWHDIALLKDKDNRYILGGPQAFASKVLWGLPVVPTRAQTRGTFTVGAFDLASQVWDRMDACVEISREDRDNFVKNMLTFLCEERLGLAHYRPKAIVKGTF